MLLKAYFKVFIKTLRQKNQKNQQKTIQQTKSTTKQTSLSLLRNAVLRKQLSEREAIIFSVYRPLTFLMQSLQLIKLMLTNSQLLIFFCSQILARNWFYLVWDGLPPTKGKQTFTFHITTRKKKKKKTKMKNLQYFSLQASKKVHGTTKKLLIKC